MLSKINYKWLIGAVICWCVAGAIMFGKSGITFSDPLNEILVCVGFGWVGTLFLVGSINNK